eukprot:gnl/TRDRNA2_/TRDRNA2_94655_c0_seq2.p1 gnl/TRDRNA2_/TRDRNA2_94655_c0~~gnl/TRDRNA2_/TRDRNA2_94655_c0_seq2.p1  ORF type:complete len:278 (-),score=44.30 gnl/TRDRNA2_/TRDRNA2_94655_c0_seq2:180-1013(-)
MAALLCAALFPQVATASVHEPRQPRTLKKQSAEQTGALNPKPRLMVKDALTGEPIKVRIHHGSVSAAERKLSSPYLVYQELVRILGLSIRDVTPVPPLALALFGGPLSADFILSEGDTGVLVVDGWIKLAVPRHLLEPLLKMRQRLDDVFAGWLVETDQQREQNVMAEHGGKVLLAAIVELLSIQQETAPLVISTTTPPPTLSAAAAARRRKRTATKTSHKFVVQPPVPFPFPGPGFSQAQPTHPSEPFSFPGEFSSQQEPAQNSQSRGYSDFWWNN